MFEHNPTTGELVRLDIAPPSVIVRFMPHHKAGLSWTATGYGKKIPTRYMVRTVDNKWRRVYCAIYSNVGTCYVMHGKNRTIVNFEGA
jgi:hypothetical protein